MLLTCLKLWQFQNSLSFITEFIIVNTNKEAGRVLKNVLTLKGLIRSTQTIIQGSYSDILTTKGSKPVSLGVRSSFINRQFDKCSMKIYCSTSCFRPVLAMSFLIVSYLYTFPDWFKYSWHQDIIYAALLWLWNEGLVWYRNKIISFNMLNRVVRLV
jgi:hypothetical protein